MTDERNRFFGRDLAYFRDVQYRDSSKLTARANLHALRDRLHAVVLVDRPADRVARDAVVLKVGCGPGWLWEQARHGVSADLELTLTDLSVGMVGEAVNASVRASVRSTARS